MIILYFINYFKFLRLSLINHCATLCFADSDERLTPETENIQIFLSKPVTKRQKEEKDEE
jgi:hypothetical protein